MRWLIFYLLIVAVIWLFIRNTGMRRGLLATVSVVFAVFMLLFTLTEKEGDTGSQTAEQFDQARQREASQYTSAKPSDVALGKTSLTNATRTLNDSSGRQTTQPDLFRWTLKTTLSNRLDSASIDTVMLQVRLFSCPDFFDTPQQDVTPTLLAGNCTRIGTRSLGLNALDLKPGASLDAEQPITFPNQPEPRNPRYWIDVQTVTATAGTQ